MAERQTARKGLGPGAFESRESAHGARTDQDLHICPDCRSDLVYPIDWAPAEDRRWSVDLRCPECEWHGTGVYDQSVVDRFDEELDRGTESLVEDLRLLAQANMEDEIESFAAALTADLILPEDF
jgi:hypothetical protein